MFLFRQILQIQLWKFLQEINLQLNGVQFKHEVDSSECDTLCPASYCEYAFLKTFLNALIFQHYRKENQNGWLHKSPSQHQTLNEETIFAISRWYTLMLLFFFFFLFNGHWFSTNANKIHKNTISVNDRNPHHTHFLYYLNIWICVKVLNYNAMKFEANEFKKKKSYFIIKIASWMYHW